MLQAWGYRYGIGDGFLTFNYKYVYIPLSGHEVTVPGENILGTELQSSPVFTLDVFPGK